MSIFSFISNSLISISLKKSGKSGKIVLYLYVSWLTKHVFEDCPKHHSCNHIQGSRRALLFFHSTETMKCFKQTVSSIGSGFFGS